MANSFEPRLWSSSGHDTRMSTYTKYRKLEISPIYIKNTFKLYVEYTHVKWITPKA
jgi:hypothetical protein